MRTLAASASCLVALSALGFGLLAPSAHAGVHAPDIEARLALIVGDWTLEGQEKTYRETCEWFGNRAFVVCTTEDRSDGTKSVSILGYSKAENCFTYHNYSDSGSSRSERGFPHGEHGIVYIDERRMAAGLARTQTTVTPGPGGRTHFQLQRSVNGGPWEVTTEFDYIPRMPTP